MQSNKQWGGKCRPTVFEDLGEKVSCDRGYRDQASKVISVISA